MKTIYTENNNTDNVTGIIRLLLVPLGSYGNLLIDVISGKNTINLVNKSDCILLESIPGSSFNFKEVKTTQDGGCIWQTVITGHIPNRADLNFKIKESLQRGEWIVIHQDSNGRIILSGSKLNPLKWSDEMNSGDDSSLSAGNNFTLSVYSPHPSLPLDITDFSAL